MPPQSVVDLAGERSRVQGHVERLKAHIRALESHLDARLPSTEAAQAMADTAIRVATSVARWDAMRHVVEKLDGR